MVLTVAVVGDERTGKTSLVAKWAAEISSCPNDDAKGVRDALLQLPDCLRSITVPAHVYGMNEAVRISDTRPKNLTSCAQTLQVADVVVVVSSVVDKVSQENVTNKWLPFIRKVRVEVGLGMPPVFEARNKTDIGNLNFSNNTSIHKYEEEGGSSKVNSNHSLSTKNEGSLPPQSLAIIATSRAPSSSGPAPPILFCSCLYGRSTQVVFQEAVKAAWSPEHILWTPTKQQQKCRLTQAFRRVLAYLFRSYDRNRDGILCDREIKFLVNDLDRYMALELEGVGDSSSTARSYYSAPMDFQQFVLIIKSVLDGGESNRLWSFLLIKGFGRNLMMVGQRRPDFISPRQTFPSVTSSILYTAKDNTTIVPRESENYFLVDDALEHLKSIFDTFDHSNCGFLSRKQVKSALFVCPVDPFLPFRERREGDTKENYKQFCGEFISRDQWVARWRYLTVCTPAIVEEALPYLGYYSHKSKSHAGVSVESHHHPLHISHHQEFGNSGEINQRKQRKKGRGKANKRRINVVRTLLLSCDEMSHQNVLRLCDQISRLGCVMEATTSSSGLSASAVTNKKSSVLAASAGASSLHGEGCRPQFQNGKIRNSLQKDHGDAKRRTKRIANSKTDSRYYFFKSTPKDLARQYRPRKLQPGMKIPKETPRRKINDHHHTEETVAKADIADSQSIGKMAICDDDDEMGDWETNGGYPKITTAANTNAKADEYDEDGPLLVIKYNGSSLNRNCSRIVRNGKQMSDLYFGEKLNLYDVVVVVANSSSNDSLDFAETLLRNVSKSIPKSNFDGGPTKILLIPEKKNKIQYEHKIGADIDQRFKKDAAFIVKVDSVQEIFQALINGALLRRRRYHNRLGGGWIPFLMKMVVPIGLLFGAVVVGRKSMAAIEGIAGDHDGILQQSFGKVMHWWNSISSNTSKKNGGEHHHYRTYW